MAEDESSNGANARIDFEHRWGWVWIDVRALDEIIVIGPPAYERLVVTGLFQEASLARPGS